MTCIAKQKIAVAALICACLAACGGGGETEHGPMIRALVPATPRVETAASRSSALAIVPDDAARQVLDLAEAKLPAYFPSHEATSLAGAFLFRFYPSTGTYLVVVTGLGTEYVQNGIYALGGSFGSRPFYIGMVSDFITPASDGELVGTLTIGPLCPANPLPLTPECQPSAAVYAAYPISIYQQNLSLVCVPVGCDKGTLIATLSPDAQGEFHTFLPPGKYVIDVQHSPVGSIQGAPANVTVSGAQITSISININTGIL